MIKWNEVTWYSKLGAALVLFGVLPVLSFYIGYQYKEVKEEKNREYEVVSKYRTNTPAPERLPLKEDVTAPSGENGLYTKEDAIKIAKRNGLWGKVIATHWFAQGYFPHDSDIKYSPAIKTGDGMGWFIEDIDPSKSAKQECGSQGGEIYVHKKFEMNEKTGAVDITTYCRLHFFD